MDPATAHELVVSWPDRPLGSEPEQPLRRACPFSHRDYRKETAAIWRERNLLNHYHTARRIRLSGLGPLGSEPEQPLRRACPFFHRDYRKETAAIWRERNLLNHYHTARRIRLSGLGPLACVRAANFPDPRRHACRQTSALCSTPRGERASHCRDALRPDGTWRAWRARRVKGAARLLARRERSHAQEIGAGRFSSMASTCPLTRLARRGTPRRFGGGVAGAFRSWWCGTPVLATTAPEAPGGAGTARRCGW